MNCEWCNDDLHETEHVVDEGPPQRAEFLRGFEWGRHRTVQRFCNRECQQRWHVILRDAICESHGIGCACVDCLG